MVLNRNEDSNSNADSYKKLASTGRNYTMGGNDTQFASLVANNIDGGEDKKATVTSEKNTLWLRLQSLLNYMILFSQFTCTGAGLMVINNIAQIELALGGEPGSEGSFVLIIGVSNCFGRMLGGYLSKVQAQVYRPLAYAIGITVMTIAQIILMFASKVLYVGAILCGMAYGSFGLFPQH